MHGHGQTGFLVVLPGQVDVAYVARLRTLYHKYLIFRKNCSPSRLLQLTFFVLCVIIRAILRRLVWQDHLELVQKL